jgi:hypothetical protein
MGGRTWMTSIVTRKRAQHISAALGDKGHFLLIVLKDFSRRVNSAPMALKFSFTYFFWIDVAIRDMFSFPEVSYQKNSGFTLCPSGNRIGGCDSAAPAITFHPAQLVDVLII